MTHATIVDFRLERLARRAPSVPLALCDEDIAYIESYLTAIGDSFGRDVLPQVPLKSMPARAFVHHLADIKAALDPDDFDQRLALGRLESVIRLVESTVTVMQRRSVRTA